MAMRPGGPMRAHRVSWVLHNGPIPSDLFVCHRCDNPPCVRPDHLFLGTVQDNNEDGQAKGHFRGERNGQAKLTDEIVRRIRSEYVRGVVGYKRLARRYGVNEQTIIPVIKRRTWLHVA